MKKIVVAAHYQMFEFQGKFSKEHKVCLRPRCVVERSFVEEYNKQAEPSGKYYEIDEEATAEYYKQIGQQEAVVKAAEKEQKDAEKAIKKAAEKKAKSAEADEETK